MWKTTVRLVGTVSAIVLSVLAFSEAPDQLRKWKGYWDQLSLSVGVDWTGFWRGNGGRMALILAAIVVGLAAWDVPQRLFRRWKHRNDPSFEEAARQRLFRTEVREFLSRLYDGSGSQALGGAFQQVDEVVAAIRTVTPRDQMGEVAANMLIELRRHFYEQIDAYLAVRDFESDGNRDKSLRAWGILFEHYQTVVQSTYEAYRVMNVSPWNSQRYRNWRTHDAAFIQGLKTLEQMEGCGAVVYFLKRAGWGDHFRPAADL